MKIIIQTESGKRVAEVDANGPNGDGMHWDRARQLGSTITTQLMAALKKAQKEEGN